VFTLKEFVIVSLIFVN